MGDHTPKKSWNCISLVSAVTWLGGVQTLRPLAEGVWTLALPAYSHIVSLLNVRFLFSLILMKVGTHDLRANMHKTRKYFRNFDLKIFGAISADRPPSSCFFIEFLLYVWA